MEIKPQVLEIRYHGQTAVLEIRRPEKKNALNSDVWTRLSEIMDEMESPNRARALVLTGCGDQVFSAGADVTPSDPFIAAMFEAIVNQRPETAEKELERIHSILGRLASLPMPTLAAFNGDAYSGGIELALACDIRVARRGAFLAFQETRLGLMPDLGGTIRLSRLVGPGRAKDLLYSCRRIPAEEALAMGLVEHVFPDKGFMDQVLAFAGTLARNSPAALKAVKTAVDASQGLDLEQALALERKQAVQTLMSGECVEGIGAFLERRSPVWP